MNKIEEAWPLLDLGDLVLRGDIKKEHSLKKKKKTAKVWKRA